MNKLLILTALTLQNAAHILTVRYTRSQSGELALTSSIVTSCEILKLVTCLFIIFYQVGFLKFKFVQGKLYSVSAPVTFMMKLENSWVVI